jgi:putative ABC transport system substrate-binding protein
MMDRRTFIARVLGGLFAAPLSVDAQPTGKTWHIGFLREGRAPFSQLLDAMRGFGWVEGQNVKIEARYADKADELPALAAELVRLKVDLLYTGGTGPTRAAKEATTTIPIVFSVGGDPVERGLVASMARPGGNLTGFALGLLDGKQLEVLKAAVPGISRVAYPVFEGANPPELSAAAALGVHVVGIAVQDPADFGPFFVAARTAAADGALIPDVARLTPHLERIAAEASKSRLPTIGFRRIFAEAGGLLSYAPVVVEMYARNAAQIDKILRGVQPAELPVEQPTRFELVINLKASRVLGLTIPPSLLLRADEVIQ